MIDIITEKKIEAMLDDMHGVYIDIYSFQDSGALEDVLDRELNYERQFSKRFKVSA